MSEQEHIRKLIKEAGIYKTQGLFAQARDIFSKALETITESETLRTNEALIAAIRAKIRETDQVLKEIDEAPQTPELSEDVTNLIKKSFSFAKDKEAAAIEGAMALAKFGQHEKALEEFSLILEKATLPVMIAKNIIRCHLSLRSPQGAVEQFNSWLAGDRFSREEKSHLRAFLENLFQGRGIDLNIPEIQDEAGFVPNPPSEEDDELDIASVTIVVDSGPNKGRPTEFEVDLQSGNTVSIIIPANRKDLVQIFKHGMRIREIQCFSPIGFFSTAGKVTGKTKVLHGANQGNFMVDIKLDE